VNHANAIDVLGIGDARVHDRVRELAAQIRDAVIVPLGTLNAFAVAQRRPQPDLLDCAHDAADQARSPTRT
jgi:hypothetical protein